jgi:hypothetical protein
MTRRLTGFSLPRIQVQRQSGAGNLGRSALSLNGSQKGLFHAFRRPGLALGTQWRACLRTTRCATALSGAVCSEGAKAHALRIDRHHAHGVDPHRYHRRPCARSHRFSGLRDEFLDCHLGRRRVLLASSRALSADAPQAAIKRSRQERHQPTSCETQAEVELLSYCRHNRSSTRPSSWRTPPVGLYVLTHSGTRLGSLFRRLGGGARIFHTGSWGWQMKLSFPSVGGM